MTSDIDQEGAQWSADIIILIRLYHLQPQPLSSFFKVLLTMKSISKVAELPPICLTCAMSRHFPKHEMCGSKCIKTHHFEPAPHPAECLGHRHHVCVLNHRQYPLVFKKECLLRFILGERNLKSSIGWCKILRSYLFVSPKVFCDQAWSYSLEQGAKLMEALSLL